MNLNTFNGNQYMDGSNNISNNELVGYQSDTSTMVDSEDEKRLRIVANPNSQNLISDQIHFVNGANLLMPQTEQALNLTNNTNINSNTITLESVNIRPKPKKKKQKKDNDITRRQSSFSHANATKKVQRKGKLSNKNISIALVITSNCATISSSNNNNNGNSNSSSSSSNCNSNSSLITSSSNNNDNNNSKSSSSNSSSISSSSISNNISNTNTSSNITSSLSSTINHNNNNPNSNTTNNSKKRGRPKLYISNNNNNNNYSNSSSSSSSYSSSSSSSSTTNNSKKRGRPKLVSTDNNKLMKLVDVAKDQTNKLVSILDQLHQQTINYTSSKSKSNISSFNYNSENINSTLVVISNRFPRSSKNAGISYISEEIDLVGDSIPLNAGIKLDMISHELQFNGLIVGIKSLVFIPKDTFLGRYVGEIITDISILEQRMREPGQHYVADLEPNKTWLCGKYLGNWLKMVNHHCIKFNCILRRFKESDNTYSLGLWTIKNINSNEGLYYHYGENDSEHFGEPISCLCQGLDNNEEVICDYKL